MGTFIELSSEGFELLYSRSINRDILSAVSQQMTYFADLSVYTYGCRDPLPNVVNVGWLDNRHPFPQGDTPPDFRMALSKICVKTRRYPMAYCGVHECEICGDCFGGHEIRVSEENGMRTYVAPDMIEHYVNAHRYKPPQDFIDAVLA